MMDFTVSGVALTATFDGVLVNIRDAEEPNRRQTHHFTVCQTPNGRLHIWAWMIPNGIGEKEIYPFGIEVAKYVMENLGTLTGGIMEFGKAGLQKEIGMYYNHWCNEFWLKPEMTNEECASALAETGYTGIEPAWAFQLVHKQKFARYQQAIVAAQP